MKNEAANGASQADAGQPPLFEERIHVGQTGGATGIGGMLTMSMLGGVPAMALAFPLIDGDQSSGWPAFFGTLGILGCAALSMAGMLAGAVLWFALEERWRKWRGKTLFSGNARVRIDGEGLLVEGLGLNAWREVLGWEGVPDSDSHLIVHTQRFGGLLLSAPTRPLLEALSHHQAVARARVMHDATGSDGPPHFEFAAQVFHWPRFQAWIWLGYLLAGALAVGLLAADRGVFKTFVGCVVACPVVALLIWAIPLARISTFGARGMRSFALNGTSLEMGGGAWRADLSKSRVILQSRSGLLYDLTFVTVAPRGGRRLDLLIDEPECATLIQQMTAACVKVDQRRPRGEAVPGDGAPMGDFDPPTREGGTPPQSWHRYY